MTTKQLGIIGVVVVLIASAYLVFRNSNGGNQAPQPEHMTESITYTPVLSPQDKQNLEAAVFETVNQKTNGKWDQRLIFGPVHKSQKAAAGKWVNQDYWDWFAWKEGNDTWRVLVSLDGWDCKELDNLPAEYKSFFRDNTYQLPSGGEYCYSHTR